MLKVGVSQRDITPPLNLNMPGYFIERYAVGVKTPLGTHAMVLDDGKCVFALVSIDIISFDSCVTSEIRRRASEKTGIKPEAIMITTTHIHTGSPTLRPGNVFNEVSRKAFENMKTMTVEAIAEAYNTRREASVYYGIGELEGYSFNRNFRLTDGSICSNPSKFLDKLAGPLAPIDRSVSSIRFVDKKGNNIGHLVNFACHCDTAGGGEFEYCADYPGEMRRILSEKYGEDSVTVFLCGCSGNVNHIDFDLWKKVGGYPYGLGTHYAVLGKALADEVLGVDENAKIMKDTSLKLERRVFKAKRRQPTKEMYEWAIKNIDTDNPTDRSYAKSWKKLYEEPKYYTNIEVQVMKVGEFVIVALPGEVYSDVSLGIKEKSGVEHIFTTALANAGVGYVPTREALEGGVYESKLSQSSSYLELDTADRMIDTAVELIMNVGCRKGKKPFLS